MLHVNKTSVSCQSGAYSSVGRGIGSGAGGLGFEPQSGWVTGKSTPSLWRDRHPAINGLRAFRAPRGAFPSGPKYQKNPGQHLHWKPDCTASGISASSFVPTAPRVNHPPATAREDIRTS